MWKYCLCRKYFLKNVYIDLTWRMKRCINETSTFVDLGTRDQHRNFKMHLALSNLLWEGWLPDNFIKGSQFQIQSQQIDHNSKSCHQHDPTTNGKLLKDSSIFFTEFQWFCSVQTSLYMGLHLFLWKSCLGFFNKQKHLVLNGVNSPY